MNANRCVVSDMGMMTLAAGMAAAVDYDLSWNSLDGGGAMRTIGGPFELSGTIGQADTGRLSGGAFELTGGFWFELAPGDCTADGGVGTFDFTDVDECMAGPEVDAASPVCNCLDFDADGDVDLLDTAEFQATFIGNE